MKMTAFLLRTIDTITFIIIFILPLYIVECKRNQQNF